MLANCSSLINIISDRSYDQKTSGYLYILQDDKWRRLYGVLKANLLFMFENQERLEIPKLLIIIEDCVMEMCDDNLTGMAYSFSIRFKTTGHSFTLATSNFEELGKWISLMTTCSVDYMLATKQTLSSASVDNTD